MRYIYILSIGLLILAACSSKEKDSEDNKKYKRFNNNYNTTFNDLPDLHTEAAAENGVGPLETRDDTARYRKELVKIESKDGVYKVDKLTHSMPFLVPKAEELLADISLNFRDSLVSKKMPLYRPIVTSVLRTNDDVKSLSKRNRNASENSVHRYGTTFDIAWTRYDKTDAKDERVLDDGRLKAVMGQVLHDLRERERCYIKHEKKQACFHITVR